VFFHKDYLKWGKTAEMKV